jgi:acid phosphatase type 7
MRIGKGIALITLSLILLEEALSGSAIPTTLDGPFEPVTSPLDQIKFRGLAVDLPKTDRRVRHQVKGFEPEQISVSLSATEDSVWISWITGCLLFI